jgi:inner membrane transporter RhtA
VRERSRRDWLTVCAFGAVLASMNLCFYGAIGRLPIGVAVTVEFVGPLALATALSRRARDIAAIVAAAVGVVAISGAVDTPWSRLDLAGLGLALAAGACWAAYIVVSGRTGARFAQLDGLAIAMTLSALVVGPIGLFTGGPALWRLDTLWRGLGIAMLSSAIPYALELVALRRLSAQVFGILLSLEPAVAALAGLVVLGQRLGAVELAGMACVVGASALVLGARPSQQPRQTDPAAAEPVRDGT